MTEALWKKFTREEITLILNESTSIKELMQKIGYNSKNGGARKQIDKMLELHKLKQPEKKETKAPACADEFYKKDVSSYRKFPKCDGFHLLPVNRPRKRFLSFKTEHLHNPAPYFDG